MVPTKGLMSFTSDEDALKIANGDGGASSSIKVPPGARRPPLKERETEREWRNCEEGTGKEMLSQKEGLRNKIENEDLSLQQN